jgi:tape measure domain-containing protein
MAFGSDLALRILIAAQDTTGGAVKSARDGITSISDTAQKVFTAVKQYLSFSVAVQGGEKFVELADRAAQLAARLKLATRDQQEFTAAQAGLARIAQETRTGLESLVALYAKTQASIRALGGSQKDSLDLTRALSEAFQVSGASSSESAAGMQQLSQALASGVLRGDEFNSVMENAPRVAQALADGLNVPIGQLRKMAEAGQLTADTVVQALLSQKDRLAAEYAQLPVTVSGAFVQLENAALQYAGSLNESFGVTQKFAGAIQTIAGNLPEITQAVGLLAAAYGVGLVKSLAAATQAKIESVRVSRDAVIAAQTERAALLERLATEQQAALLRVKTTAAALDQAKSELAVARALGDTGKAQKAYLTALEAHRVASNQAVLAQKALAAETEATAGKMSLAKATVEGLNFALRALFLLEIGAQAHGAFKKFEDYRVALIRIEEGAKLAGETMKSFFTLDMGAAMDARLDRIRAKYDAIAQGARDSSKTQADANGETASTVNQLSAAQDNLIASHRGLQAVQPVTIEQLDRLKQKAEEAGAKADGLKGSQDAQAGAMKAAAGAADDYRNALGRYVAQAEQAAGHADAEIKHLETTHKARLENARAVQTLSDALDQEAVSIRAAGDIERETILAAQDMARARNDAALAAEQYARALEKQALSNGAASDAERKGIQEAQDAATVKRRAAEEANVYAASLLQLPEALGQAGQGQDTLRQSVDDYKASAQAAIAVVNEKRAAVQDYQAKLAEGKVTQEVVTAAQRELNQAVIDARARLAEYNAALREHVGYLDRELAAIERRLQLARREAEVEKSRLQANANLYTALGQLGTARAYLNRIEKTGNELLDTETKLKQEAARMARQKAEAVEQEARADGILTDQERELIAQTQDAARMKELDAQQAGYASENIYNLADANKILKDKLSASTGQLVEQTDALNRNADAARGAANAQGGLGAAGGGSAASSKKSAEDEDSGGSTVEGDKILVRDGAGFRLVDRPRARQVTERDPVSEEELAARQARRERTREVIEQGKALNTERLAALAQAGPAASRNLTVTLKAPDGKAATGQFDEANAAAFLDVLKRSGLAAA